MAKLLTTPIPEPVPPDGRPMTMTLKAHPKARTKVLQVPVPTPGKPGTLRTIFKKMIFIPVTVVPILTPTVMIPLVFETEKRPDQDWTDYRVRIEGTRTTMSLAILETIVTTNWPTEKTTP
jgi:hypothetical protein